jgi:hypothetical protein
VVEAWTERVIAFKHPSERLETAEYMNSLRGEKPI